MLRRRVDYRQIRFDRILDAILLEEAFGAVQVLADVCGHPCSLPLPSIAKGYDFPAYFLQNLLAESTGQIHWPDSLTKFAGMWRRAPRAPKPRAPTFRTVLSNYILPLKACKTEASFLLIIKHPARLERIPRHPRRPPHKLHHRPGPDLLLDATQLLEQFHPLRPIRSFLRLLRRRLFRLLGLSVPFPSSLTRLR